MEAPTMSFGARLRQFREQQGLTFRDLSQRTGFSEQFLQDLEAHKLPMPMIEVFDLLAPALSTTPRMLLGPFADKVPEAHINNSDGRPPTPQDLEDLCRAMAEVIRKRGRRQTLD